MNSDIVIRRVSAAEVLPVRQRELRPGYAIEACVFDHDNDADTAHWGAAGADGLVGVASLYRRAAPGTDDPGAWQIRGMAVLASLQRRGIGVALVRACVAHAKACGGTVVWCNARVGAVPFYRKQGFECVSGEFTIPDVGPHVVMRRSV